MNRVILTGTLTKDIEIKVDNGSGFVIATMSIANNDRSEKQDDGTYKNVAQFFEVTLKGKFGKLLNYFWKGQTVTIDGELEQQKWQKDGQNHYKLQVLVDQYQRHSVTPHHWSKYKEVSSTSSAGKEVSSADKFSFDDDIPF